MKDINAQQLLAKVMGWEDEALVNKYLPKLKLLTSYKYDHYQRFAPGKRFIENLALWLQQFNVADRQIALDFVVNKLVFISEAELSHIVETAYPDLIVQERLRLVAEEQEIADYLVGQVSSHPRFTELGIKSLYLGLSDGARTNELRRSSSGEIGNEQIWQAYELSEDKAKDMVSEMEHLLEKAGHSSKDPRFNLIWLLDDFSGSGNTYIRYDNDEKRFKGKIKKIYERLHKGDLVDTSHYEVFLLLYVATRQAVDHIEYWSERFTSEKGYKPLQVRVLSVLESDITLKLTDDASLIELLNNPKYYDERASDKHTRVGGTDDVRLGFANCSLPVVLSHNTPNNSIYVLWGPESFGFHGLFPRLSRHREF